MSLYTKQEKVKSLWHPITDEDFEIDFSKPFIVCCVDTSLFIVKDFTDMFNYLYEDRFYDVKTQALTESIYPFRFRAGWQSFNLLYQ